MPKADGSAHIELCHVFLCLYLELCELILPCSERTELHLTGLLSQVKINQDVGDSAKSLDQNGEHLVEPAPFLGPFLNPNRRLQPHMCCIPHSTHLRRPVSFISRQKTDICQHKEYLLSDLITCNERKPGHLQFPRSHIQRPDKAS